MGVAALILGAMVAVPRWLLWPAGALTVGVLCGSAVFLGEQATGTYRFLGNQRLALGRVWLVKTLCWLGAAAGVALLFYLGTLVPVTLTGQPRPTGRMSSSYATWMPWLAGNDGAWGHWLRANAAIWQILTPGIILAHWLLYGFSTGLLLTLICRKPVVALLLAFLLCAVLAAAWVPLLVPGGVASCQVLGVPTLLLVVSRLLMRPWAADRLYTRRPLLGLLCCAVLVAAWTASGVWSGAELTRENHAEGSRLPAPQWPRR
jgi:hypothetical protein